MSQLDIIRAAIKAKIESVPGIGQVHDFERLAKTERDFITLYATGIEPNIRILGWYIRRMRFDQLKIGGRIQIINHWRIVGFMSLQDADQTEKLFDALLEQLATSFRMDNNLGGAVQSLSDGEKAGLQLDDSGPLKFAGVLCHGARCSLTTTHNL